MVDEKDVAETSKEITTVVGNDSDGNTAPVVLLLLIIVPAFLVSCTFLYFSTSYQAEPDNNITVSIIKSTTDLPPDLKTNPKKISSPIIETHIIKLQPNCTFEEYFNKLLKDILLQLYVKKELCTPEDFHDLEKHIMPKSDPNKKVPEPKGHFVIYIAVGLLLTSLLAALVDVYKVKGKPSKTKPQLTKRCSLADLTVLRHSRRESMRKDSMVDEQRGAPLKLLGRKVSRPPLRFNN